MTELIPDKCAPMMLLPPPPDKCQECAVQHEPEQPHNAQSLYYQTKFHMEHGRAATWADAMAHCDEGVQRLWRQELAKKGVPESQLRPVVAITINTQGAT